LILYCPEITCPADGYEVEAIGPDLWVVGYATVAATSPVCLRCVSELTENGATLPVPISSLDLDKVKIKRVGW